MEGLHRVLFQTCRIGKKKKRRKKGRKEHPYTFERAFINRQ